MLFKFAAATQAAVFFRYRLNLRTRQLRSTGRKPSFSRFRSDSRDASQIVEHAAFHFLNLTVPKFRNKGDDSNHVVGLTCPIVCLRKGSIGFRKKTISRNLANELSGALAS